MSEKVSDSTLKKKTSTTKKPFVPPDLEKQGFVDDAKEAKKNMDTLFNLESRDEYYLNDVGVYVYEDENQDIKCDPSLGEKMLKLFDTYKQNQRALVKGNTPTSADLGIFGADARFKQGNQTKIALSMPLSEEMLDLDHQVFNIVKDKLPEGAVPVPSVCITEADEKVVKFNEARVWRHLHGTSTCNLVAIVPLTRCIVIFVPHTKKYQEKWDDLTFGGLCSEKAHPKDNILPLQFRKQLDNLDSLDSSRSENEEEKDEEDDGSILFPISMEPGMILLTHRGMPLTFQCVEDEDASSFMIKTFAFEVPSKGSKRRNLISQALLTGYMTPGQLHENLYPKTLPMLAELGESGVPEPDDEKLFITTRAKVESVSWLIGPTNKRTTSTMNTLSISKKASTADSPAKKKKKNKQKEENLVVEEEEEEESTPHLSLAPPPEEEENDEEEEEEEKEEEEENEKKVSEKKRPRKEKEEKQEKEKKVKKTGSVKVTDAEKRNARLKQAREKHNALLQSLSLLDPLCYKSNIIENAAGKRNKVEEAVKEDTLKSPLIKKYEDSLITLEKKIEEAKEALKELPKIQESMEKMKATLDEIDASLLPEMKKERKMLNAKQNAYDTFAQMKDDLVSHAKKIYELEQNVDKLKVDSDDRLERIKNPTPKSASSSSSAKSDDDEDDQLDIEEDVDMDQIDSSIIQGWPNCQKWLQTSHKSIVSFNDLVTFSDIDNFSTLFQNAKNHFEEVKKNVKEQRMNKTPEDEIIIDVAKTEAYIEALEGARDAIADASRKQESKKSKKKIGSTVAENSKKGECESCDSYTRLWNNTSYCTECYAENMQSLYDERGEELERLAERELELLGVPGEMCQKKEQYDEYNEEFVKAIESFSARVTKASWANLERYMALLDQILPTVEKEEDEDYDEEEEDEEDEQKEKKPAKHEGLMSLKNLPSEESSAEFSDSDDEDDDSSSKKKKKRSRDDEDEKYALADRCMKTLKLVPVLDVREKILDRYSDPSKHTLLSAYLDELKSDVEHTFYVTMQSLREEEQDVPPAVHYTHFLKQEEAMSEKKKLSIPGETKATVHKRPVKWQ